MRQIIRGHFSRDAYASLGMYKKTLAGKILNFISINAFYNEPELITEGVCFLHLVRDMPVHFLT